MPHPPNVILCVCDELRAFEVDCYGHPVVRTPHIDRLADRGVRFETACSSNPVCTPARSILLTGQYSRTCNGQTSNVWEIGPRRQLAGTTLAEAYRGAGYDTASIDKWHMQPSPRDVGFDHFVYPAFRHKHRGRTYYDNSDRTFTVDGWTWDFDMNLVRSHLANRAGADRAFFLYYNIEPPHMPLADTTDHYTNMYDPGDAALRPNSIIEGKPISDDSPGDHKPEYEAIVDPLDRFYDLRADPYQMENRGPESAGDPRAERLRNRLISWHRDTPWLHAPRQA